ncbi:hypothetical protein SKAU_G00043600 [Synaphobranchus kaupii]|uniref:Uncharacterized protein n=1 Tax=Synaphobranchus kaupii TaxID=118154 RepID=A0A9Q1G1R8_SYNKA|nr:hypothetical protein SKAU_G00043600 [Synaphobranchus kaupii]
MTPAVSRACAHSRAFPIPSPLDLEASAALSARVVLKTVARSFHKLNGRVRYFCVRSYLRERTGGMCEKGHRQRRSPEARGGVPLLTDTGTDSAPMFCTRRRGVRSEFTVVIPAWRIEGGAKKVTRAYAVSKMLGDVPGTSADGVDLADGRRYLILIDNLAGLRQAPR